MSGTGATNAILIGTIDTTQLLEAILAVSFAKSGPIDGLAHPLTGTLLFVADGTLVVAASNGQHLAYDIRNAPGLSSDGGSMVVPEDFLDAFSRHGVSSPEVELSVTKNYDALHVRDPFSGIEFVQPLWNSSLPGENYDKFVTCTQTSSAQVSMHILDPLVNTPTAVAAPLTVALTPHSVILRDQFQLLGPPVAAQVWGAPLQIVVGNGAIDGAKFIQAGSHREFPDVYIQVFSNEGLLWLRGVRPVDTQGNLDLASSGYITRSESQLAELVEIDNNAPVPSESYVPDTVTDSDEKDLDVDEILAKFQAITGQPSVKTEVEKLVTQANLVSRRASAGLKGSPLAMNFVFSGPPGTGKTTVARLLAELLSALGMLPTSKLVEVDRSGLISGFVGGTEEKTLGAIEDAMGGVLFIDEAYALAGVGGNDTGKQAIETLLKAIEDRRGEFACITAGYTDKMVEFMDSNPGMKSRFTRFINFEPYSADELLEIGTSMAQHGDNALDDEAKALLRLRLGEEELRGGFESPDWGNARSMRNLIEAAVDHRNLRISKTETFDLESLSTLTAADVTEACATYRIGRSEATGESVEDVLAELAKKIGQPALKQQIKILVSSAKITQMKAAHGLGASAPDLPHLLFMGPPGTGKTSIARVLARLYKSLGLLSSGHVVEVDQSDLISSNVGGTAEQTTKKINEAIGGVLFIDEAYALSQGNQFGAEAINTLLKRMTDDQGKFLVIAAGYTGAMQDFLKANDGLSRRFATKIEFETYTADELTQIAVSMLEDHGERFTPDAEQLLLDRLTASERAGIFERPDWGNAGSMGNLTSHAARLRNQRLTGDTASVPSREALATITAEDLGPACDEILGSSAKPQESLDEVLAELDKQVGQPALKQQINVLINGAKAAKLRAEHGLGATRPDLPHLMFMGPPGTGKTSIARLIARLYKALGLLPSGHVVEVDQSHLVAGYVGQTAIKTTTKIDEAMGGVLFIDEAYTLAQGNENSFGREAVDTLLKRMTDDTGKFLVIAAGYSEAMGNFLKMNDGLPRRFPTKIEFDSYTAPELAQIAQIMVESKGEILEPDALTLLEDRLAAAERAGLFGAKDWGNAGSVGNLIAQASRLRNLRLFSDPAYQPTGNDLMTITASDIADASDEILGTGAKPQASLEDVLAELAKQVGQPALKRQVSALMAGVRAQQARAAAGLGTGGTLIEHLVFTGPPGTGKTTIARLLAQLYKALGVLPGGHVVEVDRAGLVAGYIGQTATKTEEQITKAMGGVLFIDEAYTLAGDAFGKEAIDTLLARMENDRGKFMVIAAGYPEQMGDFLKSNPGLPSRFTQTIDFHAYNSTELTQIAASMATGNGETLSDGAIALLADRLAAAELRGILAGREWGNARAVRNVINKATKARDTRLYSDPAAAPDVAEMTLITRTDMEEACDSDGLAADAGTVRQLPSNTPAVAAPDVSVGTAAQEPPARQRWRSYDSEAERDLVRTGIKELVGRAAQKLAPGVLPGKSAPVGPELTELGFAEIYWQGGSSMGIQIRFTAGSRDRMHYFAGGSNGNLPDAAGFMGKQVGETDERPTLGMYPLQTLEEWRDSDLDLADHILASIRADLAANPE